MRLRDALADALETAPAGPARAPMAPPPEWDTAEMAPPPEFTRLEDEEAPPPE